MCWKLTRQGLQRKEDRILSRGKGESPLPQEIYPVISYSHMHTSNYRGLLMLDVLLNVANMDCFGWLMNEAFFNQRLGGI